MIGGNWSDRSSDSDVGSWRINCTTLRFLVLADRNLDLRAVKQVLLLLFVIIIHLHTDCVQSLIWVENTCTISVEQ